MQKKMQKKNTFDIIRIIFYAIAFKLIIYGIFSIFFMWLMDWAGILNFNFRYVMVMTVAIFFIWFFIENNIVAKLKK